MIVTDTLPNLNSVEMTPYSDMIERSDYMSHPIFFTDSIGNANTTTSPAGPASPSRLNQPTRPPLFSGHSITLAVANTETDITKTLLTRSKKFLDPEAAGADSMTRPPSTTSNRSETYFVEFRVIDTGPGVAEHMQSKIFEPFIQGDFGLSRKYGGTGLGLSICQQLAKIMGGEIHLKSFEGTGSTFTLRIPLRFAAISLVSSAPHPAHALSVSMKSMESEHATVNSLGTFSGPVFSNRSGQERATSSQEATNLNLAGLSQSFFIPSRAESEVEDNDGPIASPSPPASSPLQRQEPSKNGKGTSSSILPIVAVTTPDGGTGEAAGTKAGLPLFDSPLSNTDRRNGIGSLSEEDEGRDNDQTIRVLVVEDNKINQNLVVKVLQLEHIQDITVAEDGRQAIDRVREQIDKGLKFDIIFMDIQVCVLTLLPPFSLVCSEGSIFITSS
jgi:osomolarity two-component system sensor histidine kinase SLN1